MKYFLLFIIFISLFSHSEEKKIVAKVNGVELFENDLMMQVDFLKSQLALRGQDPKQVPEDILKENALTSLIELELAYQAAKNEKITVKEEEIKKKYEEFRARFKDEKEFNDFLNKQNLNEKGIKSEIEREMIINKYIEKSIFKDFRPIQDIEIKKYYEENPNNFIKPERVRASHILVSVPKDADEKQKKELKKKAEVILKELKNGAKFEDLAKEKSDCPSKEKGGDLGFFTKGQMVKPFEDAAFSLKTNTLSNIVESEFGYHIILVKDHLPEEKIKFEDSKDKIQGFLESKKKQELIQKRLSELSSKAKIENYLKKEEHKH